MVPSRASIIVGLLFVASFLVADVYQDDLVYRLYYSAVVQGWVANDIQVAADELVETGDAEKFFERMVALSNFLADRSNDNYVYLQGVTVVLGINMKDLQNRLQGESIDG